MHKGAGTLRTIIVVLGSSWFSLLLNFVKVLVLPGKLKDGGLGDVYLAISFTGFFGVFTALGVSTYMVRAVARDEQLLDRYISNAFLLRLVMSAGVLALVMAIANLFGYAHDTQVVIFIVAVQMVIFTISNVFESGLQAIGKMGYRAVAVAIGQGTSTIIGVGLLLAGAGPILYAVSLPLGTTIQIAIVLAYYFRKRPIRFSFDRQISRLLLVGGMPLFLWTFLQSAYGQIDATILSLFADKHVVGWFGAAGQITNMLFLVPGAITAVALPVLCELYVKPGNEFDRLSARTTTTTLLVMAPLGVGLALSAADVLRLLHYPEVFQNAAPVLSLLALALPVTGVMMVLGTMAVAIGLEKQWLKISAFAVCIFPPLYVVLIWFFQTNYANGAIGAGLANLVGESTLLVWAWFVLPGRLRQTELLKPAGQIVTLSLVMVAVVVALQWAHVSILVYVPLAGSVYMAGAWVLKLVTTDDVQMLRGAVLRRSRRAQAVPSET